MKEIILIITIFLLFSCIEKKDTDIEKPNVSIQLPAPCDTLYFGESFRFKIKIDDNTGLGNINMDLHHNFGHHNHGSHASCNMDPAKDAINPYTNNWQFSLPGNQLSYILDTLIQLPLKKDSANYFDTGDYHFHMYITDNEGYQAFTTMDVKIKLNER